MYLTFMLLSVVDVREIGVLRAQRHHLLLPAQQGGRISPGA
jgi:hypothetical protein